jgi:transposase-like protein
MTADPSVGLNGFPDGRPSRASPDLLRQMITTVAEALMAAEADALCGAGCNQRCEERVNHRTGYRDRR